MTNRIAALFILMASIHLHAANTDLIENTILSINEESIKVCQQRVIRRVFSGREATVINSSDIRVNTGSPTILRMRDRLFNETEMIIEREIDLTEISAGFFSIQRDSTNGSNAAYLVHPKILCFSNSKEALTSLVESLNNLSALVK